ncbi:MAG: ABC transporter ATP-binding protein [Aquificaceae bacterium]|uniref:ABC transporter ATP-binding protein n=1 Tax=Hydrogenobacter sp. Uz 6-8 TaxID=3384828 RepID=UPI0030954EC3
MKAFLTIDGVYKSYGKNPVLGGIYLNVGRGEFVSLIGHSGCGKSTLLRIVAGIEKADRGNILLDGSEITESGPDRAVVFQDYGLFPWFTLYENVYHAVDSALGKSLNRQQKREIVMKYLSLVGLEAHSDKYPAQTSGGMKQRVAIARALAVNPKVLLLDEPFGALDALTRATLQDELLKIWESDKKTVLMVTHDVDEAIYLSDRIVVMSNGPSAKIYEIVSVAIKRPRNRSELLNDKEYLEIKKHLLNTLQERLKKSEVQNLEKVTLSSV